MRHDRVQICQRKVKCRQRVRCVASCRDAECALISVLQRNLATRSLIAPPESQTTTVSADLDRAPHAPINCLPLELLVEIFRELLARIIDDRDSYVDPLTRLEITVTHVCSFWRYVAYNTPTLWTYISYPIDSYLQRFLPLSGDCLLDLELGSLRHVTLTIIEKLRPLAPRWHSLRICANSEEKFHEIQTWSTQQLEYFQIYLQYSDSLNSRDVANFLTNAPRLRHLTINARSRSEPNCWSKMLFSRHLTSLTLEIACLSSPSIDILLKQCRETLGELVLHALRIEPQPGPPKRPVDLPALKRLQVHRSSCAILRYIDTPNIEEIAFDYDPDQTFPALYDFFLRYPTASTRVRRFEVNPDWPIIYSVFQCLFCTTRLARLRFIYFGRATKIVEVAIFRNNAPSWPSLAYIQLFNGLITTRLYKQSLPPRSIRSAVCRYGSVGTARLLQYKGAQNDESWYWIMQRAFGSR
ncbi:hypothetical protein GGG16DRAFT_62782 [Schizophyllum commune]